MPLSRFWVGLNPSSSTIRLLEATQPHWLASRYLSKFQFGALLLVARMMRTSCAKPVEARAVMPMSHKGMIIGKQGSMLKKIASQSRAEIEAFLDTRVNLQCWVKVREDWRNSEFSIRDLGFN